MLKVDYDIKVMGTRIGATQPQDHHRTIYQQKGLRKYFVQYYAVTAPAVTWISQNLTAFYADMYNRYKDVAIELRITGMRVESSN